ncbi:cytochrome P450 [Solwaraspora sp. WMMA2101]|uniref:cytochrome P450 n=1 Tax=Solwaraspora sp. WMMA2101 TaxID=3404124 RepID=UPI003B928B26
MSGGCPHYPFPWPSQTDQPREFADLHRQPVLPVRLPSGDRALLVTGYHEVRALLTDPRISKNRQRPDMARMTPPADGPPKHFGRQVQMDPPGHTRMRRLIAKAFSGAQMARLRPRVAQRVDDLLDAMTGGQRPVDLGTAFAHPLSLHVICDLLGVPEGDRAALAGMHAPPWDYLGELIERRRSDPDDGLISALIEVSDADDGRLSPTELHWWCTVLLLAGYETTAHQLLSAVVLLLEHPDQLATLRADPTAMPTAVEELLRHQVVGTSLSMLRYVTDDIDLGGTTLPKGSSVVPSLECANHDPAVFTDPLTLDLRRAGPAQLTFSFGRHFCVGASLARVELELGLAGLLTRLPTLRLAVSVDRLRRREDPFTQGFTAVPVTW